MPPALICCRCGAMYATDFPRCDCGSKAPDMDLMSSADAAAALKLDAAARLQWWKERKCILNAAAPSMRAVTKKLTFFRVDHGGRVRRNR